MKYLKILLLAFLFGLPVIAYGVQVSVPSAPGGGFYLISTTTGNYVATTSNPLHATAFYATSSTATSTFAGSVLMGNSALNPYVQVGSTTIPAGMGNIQGNYFQIVGNQNNAAGVEGGILNTSPGTSAFSFFYFNNDLADPTVTHYAGFQYNSSKFSDATLGTEMATSSSFQMYNTDGPIQILASTSTWNGYISFSTASQNTSEERMRITNAGNIGISTTTPGSRLSIQGNEFIAGNIVSTSTLASIFPYASTTALSASGQFLAADGTAGAPSYSFGNALNMGLYKSSASLGFSVGGVGTFQMSGNQLLSAQLTTAAAPAFGQTAGSQFTGIFFPNATGNVLGFTQNGSEIGRFQNGQLLIGTTTGNGNSVIIGSSTQAQLMLTDNSPTTFGWDFRAVGNNLYIATSTTSGTGATSTVTALTIDPNAVVGVTAFKDSALTSGNCVQAGTGGLLTTIASSCGSTFTPEFTVTLLNSFSTTTLATTTSIWTKGIFIASSTAAASQFPYASTTMISAVTASTTNLYVSGAPNALALMGVDGLLGKYGGSAPCTNQVALSISALGVIACTTVTNAMLTNSSITVTPVGNASVSGSPVSLGGTVTVTVPWEWTSGSFGNAIQISTTTGIHTVGTFTASSTAAASQFPYASSTGLTAGNLFSTNASTTFLTVSGFATMNSFFATSSTATSTIAGALTIGTTTQTGPASNSVLTVSGGLNSMGGIGLNMYDLVSNAFTIKGPSSTIPFFNIDITNRTGAIFSVGSSTPWAALSVQANNGDTNSMLFNIASSTQTATTSLFAITNYGDIITKGVVPTIGGPGTQTISATSTDMRGTINMTANGATVNVVFSRPKADSPTCIVGDDSTTLIVGLGSMPSTTGMQIKTPATFTGNINYICLQ